MHNAVMCTLSLYDVIGITRHLHIKLKSFSNIAQSLHIKEAVLGCSFLYIVAKKSVIMSEAFLVDVSIVLNMSYTPNWSYPGNNASSNLKYHVKRERNLKCFTQNPSIIQYAVYGHHSCSTHYAKRLTISSIWCRLHTKILTKMSFNAWMSHLRYWSSFELSLCCCVSFSLLSYCSPSSFLVACYHHDNGSQ